MSSERTHLEWRPHRVPLGSVQLLDAQTVPINGAIAQRRQPSHCAN
jgi:hypothetical protein